MRLKIALMTLLLMLLSVGTALSQAPLNIYDTLKAAGNFKTFLSAVDKANVQELKQMPGASGPLVP